MRPQRASGPPEVQAVERQAGAEREQGAAAAAGRTALAALLVKDGVLLGGLGEADRRLALAVAATAIEAGREHREPEVNAALRRCLAGPAAFLDVDHVELRRWLVDSGWWQRDGFGRAYVRVPAEALPPPLRELDAALAGIDLAAFAAAERRRLQEARAARRAAWQARAAGG